MAGRSATCGSASCNPLTSVFRALVHPESLNSASAHFADVHGGMLFEAVVMQFLTYFGSLAT